VPTEEKYKGTIERMARGLRGLSTDTSSDMATRFARALFAWLVADGDMHLKNVALLKVAAPGARTFESVRMAPLYDTLTTRVFPGLEHDHMALRLAGRDDRLRLRHFETFARTIDLQIGRARDIVDQLVTGLEAALAKVKLPPIVADSGAMPTVNAVMTIVRERCAAFASDLRPSAAPRSSERARAAGAGELPWTDSSGRDYRITDQAPRREEPDPVPGTSDHLRDALARRKAEALAEALYPRTAPRSEGALDRAERLAAMHSLVPAPREPRRDTPLRKALWFAAFGEWDDKSSVGRLGGRYPADKFVDALVRFHQAAADGALHVWGKPVSNSHTRVFVPIPKEHWTEASVEMPTALRKMASSTATKPGTLTYSDIQVSGSEFEREFPPS
jgi:HipA-like C-terminal domain